VIIFKRLFNKYDETFSTGLNWLQVLQNVGMYCVVEQLVAFQEGFSSTGLLAEGNGENYWLGDFHKLYSSYGITGVSKRRTVKYIYI
jgi:hypothetical protein